MMKISDELKNIETTMNFALAQGMSDSIIKEFERQRNELMYKKKILSNFNIKQEKGGRWYCNIKLSKGAYKTLHGKTMEEVEQKLLDFLEQPKYTIKSLYNDYITALVQSGHARTAARYDYDYKRYLDGTNLIEQDIVTLKTSEFKTYLIEIIKGRSLTKRKYRDIKTIINGVLDMAVEDDIIPINRARGVKNISNDLFAPEKPELPIFSDEESEKIILCCMKRYTINHNPSYLALILNFLLGLRVGELAALKYEDFDFLTGLLHVCREETEVLEQTENGFSSVGRRIVNHLKSGHKDRDVVIDTDATKHLVDFIKASCGSSEWLFEYPDRKRATAGNISRALQMVNKELQLPVRGNHKIRKTVISKMIQSGLFSTTEIMQRAGHKDYHTTQKYYARPLPDPSAHSKIASVLGMQVLDEIG